MAELLIKARDSNTWRAGDVVAALPDGHVFGREESLAVWTAEGRDPAAWPGHFVIVRIPGLLIEMVRAWTDPYFADLDAARAAGADLRGRRRRYRLDLDALPAAARTALAKDGEATLGSLQPVQAVLTDGHVTALAK